MRPSLLPPLVVGVVGAVLLVAWVAVGPLGVAALAALALLPRLRPRWAVLRPARPAQTAGLVLLALAVVAGLLVALPERWVPALPGPGLLVTSSYDGRPARAQPLPDPASGPATGADRPDLPVERPGPVGDLPRTSTAALGWPGHGCAPVGSDLEPPVLLCGDGGDGDGGDVSGGGDRSRLVLLDGGEPVDELVFAAAGACPLVAAADRARVVVADGARLRTATAAEGRLVPASGLDLDEVVAADDCAVDLGIAADGATWVLTRAGRVVRVEGRGATVLDQGGGGEAGSAGGGDAQPGEAGGMVVTQVGAGTAVTAQRGRVTAVAQSAGRATGPGRRWSADLGGTLGPPAVVDGRWVAVGVDDGPRAALAVLDVATGEEECRVDLFEDGAGRLADHPVALPGAVLVRNAHPDASDGDGLALVRLPGCDVAWTGGGAAAAPVTVSRETGLAYAVQRSWSPWLVPVTRLAAVDPWSGRQSFAVRVATGLLGAPVGTAPALGPDGAAYVVVRGGLVRVADRG